MIGLELQHILTPLFIFNPDYSDYKIGDFDYYVYNNRYFTPVEVDLQDIISPDECLLHICQKNADPSVDRFDRPHAIYSVLNLYRNHYLSVNQVPQF